MKTILLFLVLALSFNSFTQQHSIVHERHENGAKKMASVYTGKGTNEKLIKTIWYNRHCSNIPEKVWKFDSEGRSLNETEYWQCTTTKYKEVVYDHNAKMAYLYQYHQDGSVKTSGTSPL